MPPLSTIAGQDCSLCLDYQEAQFHLRIIDRLSRCSRRVRQAAISNGKFKSPKSGTRTRCPFFCYIMLIDPRLHRLDRLGPGQFISGF
jgi:hypothetical protein